MSSYIAIVIVLAIAQVTSVPISQEYGTPFETYGLPSDDIHSEVRPKDVPILDVRFDTPLRTPISEVPEIFPIPKVPEVLEEREPIVPIIKEPIRPIVKAPVVLLKKVPEDVSETLPIVRAPVVAPPNSHISLRDEKNQYSVGFQSPDGTEVKEQGRLISTDNGWEYVIAKTGSYKYISPEGKEVAVEWIADEKGFRILSTTV